MKTLTFQSHLVSRVVWLALLGAGFVLGGLYLGAGTTSLGNILAFSAGMGSAFLLANEWAQGRYGAESCGVLGRSLMVAVRTPGRSVQTAQFTGEHPCALRMTAEGLIELSSDRQRIVFGEFAPRDSLEHIAGEIRQMARSISVLQPDVLQESQHAQ